MLTKKLFNFLSKFHYNSIYEYSKNLNFEIMIDVGSHQGEFISRFLHHKKVKKFFCFEPNKKLFKKLYKKYKSNKKVLLFDFALGENYSNKKLFLSNLTYNSTMSTFNKDSNYLKFKNLILRDQKNKNFISIKQKTFNEVFKKKNIKNSFLKIDVEGYEYNVLKGALKKIKDPKYILIEHQFSNQYQNNFDKVKKLLIKYNFIMIKSFYYPTLHYRDILFINKRYKINID
jgi:FkbM family methyltransferase